LPPPPSRCKPTLYVRLISACVAGLLFSTSALAQILPPLPSTLRSWTATGSGDWGDASNWSGGNIPTATDHNAFFGNLDEGNESFVTNDADRFIGSLWFDAGTFYTLQGTGEIKLKRSGEHLIVVRSKAGDPQSEHNIENVINVSEHNVPGDGGLIENYSEGGLRLGGRFALGDHSVIFSGTGAIHIAGEITGNEASQSSNGNIKIEGAAGTVENVHVIFSGYNPTKGGKLDVYDRGFAIFKRDQALGSQTDKYVNFGGTVGFRSHIETDLTYSTFSQNTHIYAAGLGIVRLEGTQQIGAIYNDGGKNTIAIRIGTKSDNGRLVTGFGSRGDRKGGLELSNYVGGDGSFLKLGPGLIVLNNTSNQVNNWGHNTTLHAGVLRIGNANSLAAVNLIFEGGIHTGKHGGILELGYSNSDGSAWSRSLGTGDDQVRWTGDGGFSAFGGARSVSLSNNGTDNAALTWDSTAHFLGDGHALLLSSRYANNVITFTNDINLNGKQREVRVARGENPALGATSAHAVLSGVLSGAGGGLLKTGDGLLYLTGSNTYTGATRIEAGALRGAAENTSSNIVLAGGILGLDGNFNRSLGTGGNRIRWAGSGGFAAYGSARTINIGSSNTVLTWGAANFVGDGQELRFGHHTADATVRWNRKLNIGSGTRTIHIENGNHPGADVDFRQAISGTADSALRLVGNGRIDFTANNSELLAGKISIYGAELRLHGAGKLSKIAAFDIRHGGELALRNSSGNASTRLKQTVTDSDTNTTTLGAEILLSAGNLLLESTGTDDISEQIGDLRLAGGSNTITLRSNGAEVELHINQLHRDADSRATLNLFRLGSSSATTRLKLTHSASDYAINDVPGGDEIIPWATNGDDWLVARSNGENHFLEPLVNYWDATGTSANWVSASNVRVNASGIELTGTAERAINSLVMKGDLDIAGHRLTLNSGGLIALNSTTFTGTSGSHLTTGLPGPGARRPLYIHVANGFTIAGAVQLFGWMDVIKSQTGTLTINSTANHQIGSLYVHQGTVDLSGSGNLTINADGSGRHYRIYIGDGAGTDILILPGGRWNPIRKSGGLPSITLRGTPYDPRGPEYSGGEAILQLGGNGGSDRKTYGAGTKQQLANLHIEGRGTIDWRGGEVGLANILWIDELTFSSTSDILFIRNWYEYEDLFLVKKVNFDTALLSQIVFEGYQDYFPTLKDYDANYWQITPWGAPEPSTYGAILGVVGIGLVAWRRRRTTKQGDLNRTVPQAR